VSHEIGILQPGFLPWLGFFEQMHRVQTFVVLDDVQHTKQDWRVRNRIRSDSPEGFTWLSVPVRKHRVEAQVRDIEVSYDHDWTRKHLNLIHQYYAKAPYFEAVFPELKRILGMKPASLVDLDMQLTVMIASFFSISAQIVYSSSLRVPGRKTEKLVNICKAVEATALYDGWSAQNFIEQGLFEQAGIGLVYQKYVPLAYPQMYSPFMGYLSALDLLLNCGPDSLSVLVDGAATVVAVPSRS